MRTLNVRLTAILLAILTASGAGAYVLHAYHVQRNAYVFNRKAERLQEKAKQAAKAKNFKLAQETYQEAAKTLAMYVRLVPDDIDALEKLGFMLVDMAQDPRGLTRGWMTLERVLREDPERISARRRLVHVAIMLGRFHDAKQHLRAFLLGKTPQDAELWDLLAQCQVEVGEYDEAVKNFNKALELSPFSVDTYPRLARVLQTHYMKPKEAEQLMQRLLEKNPKSGRAHFLRGAYLLIVGANQEAIKEALRALELTPDDSEALSLMARSYLTANEFAKARVYAARSIKLYPDNVDAYINMVDIEMRAGHNDRAVATLQQGLKTITRSPHLLWLLANLLIDMDKLPEAEKVIGEMQAINYSRKLVEYLNARIEMAQGHWLVACQRFEQIRGTLITPELSYLLKQVDVSIGTCYGELGNHDQQIAAYRRAKTFDPFYLPARTGLMDALLLVGNVDEALKEHIELARLGKVSAPSMMLLARAVVNQNLRRAPAERDWPFVEKVVNQAERAMPGSVQIPILRAEILVAQGRLPDAEALLQKACGKPPRKSDLWLYTSLISLAQRQQDWGKSAGLLEASQKLFGDTVELRIAQAEDVAQRKDPKAVDRMQKLAENVERFSTAERAQLWASLANTAARLNDLQHARQFCQRVAEKQPYNLEVYRQLFELAHRAGDEGAMSQALKDVRRIAGPDAYWHYGQALQLSMQARDAHKDKATVDQVLSRALKHLSEARELQPTWPPVLVLTGGICDQQGRTDSALKNYLEAIDLGECNAHTVQRAIQLLFEKHRYADANRLLGQMERQQLPFSPDATRANAMVALYRGDFDRALGLARKAASAHSQNYQEHIWLGQVLGIIGRWAKEEGRTKNAQGLLDEGERALRRAVEIEPKTAATWVALVQFLSAGGAKDQAEKAIQEAGRKIPAKQASLVLAQCYEAVQNTEAAQTRYEAAAAAAPRDPLVVRTVADFYCRSQKTALAEAFLQRIIGGKVEAPEADVLWARRQLAMITVARGGYENLQKARDLIDKNLAVAEVSILDQRVKADLDAADPAQSRRKAAITTLETMVQEQSASPDDRFKLAQMYLAAGNWIQAGIELRSLVASYENEPRYLAAYVTALLQHGETTSAEIYLDRLEKTQPNSVDTVNLRARTLVQKNEPEKAIELLRAFIDKPNAQPPDRKVRLRMMAMQLEQLARGELTKPAQKPLAERFSRQAEAFYQAYIDQDPGHEFEMVAFLGSQGRIDEALSLLDGIWDRCKPLVISQVCSTILEQNNQVRKEQMQRMDRILQKAIQRFDRPVPLLMIRADLCGRQGLYVAAEQSYREVLQKDGSHASAMNNLAVLLALQGIKLEESLKLVNQAIKIAGPMAAILDSRATVYIALGEPKKALADLAGGGADDETPLRLFHQAQAYELAGQHDAASAALEKALQKGLTKEMLHPLELPSFEKLSQLVRQTDSSRVRREPPADAAPRPRRGR